VLALIDPRATFVESSLPLTRGAGTMPLQPGEYYVSPWEADVPMTYREFRITAGNEANLDIELPAHVHRWVRWPVLPQADTFLELRCFDAAGRQVLRMPVTRRSPETLLQRFAFAPGSYALRVDDARGKSRSLRFTITAEPDSAQVIEIPLP
jgi:hypothetical protein